MCEKSSKTGNNGFSLIELIVVVLIMGIIAVLVSPAVIHWVDKSRIAVDRNSLDAVQDAVNYTYLNEEINRAATDKIIKITITHFAESTKIEADTSIKTSGNKTFEDVFNESSGGTIDDFVFKKVHDAVLVYKNGVLQAEGTVIPEEFINDLAED